MIGLKSLGLVLKRFPPSAAEDVAVSGALRLCFDFKNIPKYAPD